MLAPAVDPPPVLNVSVRFRSPTRPSKSMPRSGEATYFDGIVRHALYVLEDGVARPRGQLKPRPPLPVFSKELIAPRRQGARVRRVPAALPPAAAAPLRIRKPTPLAREDLTLDQLRELMPSPTKELRAEHALPPEWAALGAIPLQAKQQEQEQQEEQQQAQPHSTSLSPQDPRLPRRLPALPSGNATVQARPPAAAHHQLRPHRHLEPIERYPIGLGTERQQHRWAPAAAVRAGVERRSRSATQPRQSKEYPTTIRSTHRVALSQVASPRATVSVAAPGDDAASAQRLRRVSFITGE